ncbi:maleylpyruvate isomerase N-terminal domain-containing protein [Streptomyces sp. ISL-11]|uniref:maleylpyruvate isomerase N-terminal domain-containing protein n=1 Tax=Streptomyces sp. ISL-11 TaxID=2819174 RepID=UPI001BEBFC8E|nr:maleylpyruvate isomerase N-terminal domain-containing protein [Streptomyces sp. ISL-11]MBT2387175.1 maleylpyruvate isomerase N-terminal domain-containing protein [Streptomyces sp. ISL-11]
MTKLSHDRYCSEVVRQTELLRSALRGADLTAAVPTCPEWTLAHLLLHLGQAHRYAEGLVRTRTTEFEVPAGVGGPPVPGPGDPALDAGVAAFDAWLAEGAETVAKTLREAGPDSPAWTFGATQTASFWARRMTHETVMHRADAEGTTGVEFAVAQDVAADCVDEWLEIIGSPMAMEYNPKYKELLGPGRTLHLHATDTPPELDAEWFVDFSGERVEWRRAHAKAAVALRGPLTDVLSVFYRRRPADTDRVEIVGDRELLDFWLERTSF